MDFVTMRKQHIRWNIDQNPTTITINRKEQVRVGGGYDEKITSPGSFVVRIFPKGTKSPMNVSSLAGTKQTNASWSLLADFEADIQAGSNVKDEFEAIGLGQFTVEAVRPQIWKGIIVGYQADLERVG